ncbi:unnamed protein product [Oikopleura dioica]|uniref:Uncharacterized protein n=1 Tax=Oikopleura dioica TaxID=34765 RepID=E4Z0N4_OIKDI|nr:unnamed protein product [Oikopleura dioica]
MESSYDITWQHIAMIESNNESFRSQRRLATCDVHNQQNALSNMEMSWFDDSLILDAHGPNNTNMIVDIHEKVSNA